jgi:hypothetical protein
MAVKTSAADAAANWASGFGGSATKYSAGIDAVTVAPGLAAAQQQAAYLAGVQNNVKIWAQKVAAVDLNTWKAAAKGTGASRLASGATKGAPKMQAFMNAFLPQLTNVVGSLPARGTFDQNMQRFTAFATALHNMKGQF